MSPSSRLALPVAVLVFAWAFQPASAELTQAEVAEYVDALMSCSEVRIPGLAVGVHHNGDVIARVTAGVLEHGGSTPVTDRTIFNLGSASRLPLSVSLQIQILEGQLGWEDLVTSHLPSLAPALEALGREDLSMEDLLSDHSNLAPSSVLSRFDLDANELEPADFAAEKLPHFAVSRSFRAGFEPFPFGPAVAAAAFEAASGLTWDGHLREIFDLAGVEIFTSTSEVLAEHPERYASPHGLDEDGALHVLPKTINLSTEGASAPDRGLLLDLESGLNLVTHHVFEFDPLINSSGYTDISDAFRSRYPEDVTFRQGGSRLALPNVTLSGTTGPFRDTPVNLTRVGGAYGMSALFAVFPEYNIGVVILTNQHGISEETLSRLAAFVADEVLDYTPDFTPENACEHAAAERLPVDRSADFPPVTGGEEWFGTWSHPLFGEVVVGPAGRGNGEVELHLGPQAGLVRQDGDNLLWGTDGFAGGWHHYRLTIDPDQGVLGLDLRKGEGGDDVVTFVRDQVQVTSIPPSAGPEGDADHVVTFTVERQNATSETVEVMAEPATGSTATAGLDFLVPPAITFGPGETEKIVELTIRGDTLVEPDETIVLALGDPSGNLGIGPDAIVTHTIRDDDTAQVSVAGTSGAEGDAGTTPIEVAVSLSAGVQGGLTVSWATADGTATVADGDYAAAAGSLAFVGTSGEAQIAAVDAHGDTVVEPDEVFEVALGTLSPADPGIDPGLVTVAGAPAQVVIVDDDEGVHDAAFAAEKTVAGDGTLLPGAPVEYTIVVTNLGPADRADLPGDELEDVLPPELVLHDATADVGSVETDPVTRTVTWNGPLAAGESAVVTITAEVGDDVPLETPVWNQAELHYDADNDGVPESLALSDDPATDEGNDPTRFVVAADSVVEIPTLEALGLFVLALLLSLAGWVFVRRVG